jgi:PAS domain S-box-containing protein
VTTPARALRLLIVADSPEDRAELRRLLESSELHYALAEVGTGARAIAALKDPAAPLPDAVILDLHLPDMNGHDVLHALRGDDGAIHVPVIVLTGAVGREERAAILRSGAHDFIGKEWLTPASLTRSIESTLERFVIQRELLRREERLLLAFEVARMGCWDWDIPADQVRWSDDLCPLFGPKPALFASTVAVFFASVHPGDRARVQQAVAATLARSVIFEIEFRVVHPDGSVRWAASKARLLRDADGTPSVLAGVSLDITARKEIEARREALLAAEQAARVEAERLGRMKDEFLATLSHELRTPLNAILGWIGILQGRMGDEALERKALGVIDRNARLQAQLIEDLLDMNRILSGKLRLTPRPTSLASVAQAAVETVRPMADVKDVALEVDLHPGSGMVYGDPDRLQQIAWNMLSNAIKFTNRGGVVRVALAGSDEGFALSVSDTGPGIAPEFLPHVFERFRQADASAARRHGGLGLGLAIVRQIAELHGGTARVASEGLGKGSTFTLVLPSLEDSTPASATLPESGEREPLSSVPLSDEVVRLALTGIRVLVVDDQEDAREFLERLLAERGAFVTVAASAEEALAELDRAPPDVLVADIGMPDLDGYELIRRVRRRESARGGAVHAVALTAFVRDEDRERALAAGYEEHVPKPVEPSALFAVIARLARGGVVARVG